MPIARSRALWRDIYESLWLLPALFTLGALVAAGLLVRMDALPGALARRELDWLFAGGPDAARSVLAAIAASFITVTGVVFSVTIVALQLAASQYTPRVLRTFMADRSNQLVLAVFIATFVYSLAVMRSIHDGGPERTAFVPAVAVTASVGFAIVSIGFLIYYVHHAARSIQIETIMAHVTTETLGVIRAEYCERATERFVARNTVTPAVPGELLDDAEDADWREPENTPQVVHADVSGYLTALDEDALMAMTQRNACVAAVQVRVGEFIYPGLPLLRLWGDGLERREVDELRRAFAMGPARTHHQDPSFGIVELVDIAVKALSPGINDPTTAMNAFDRLGEVLLEMGRRRRVNVIQGRDGAVLVLDRPSFAECLDLASDQVARFAADNPAVIERMALVLRRIAPLMPHDRRPAIRAQLERIRALALDRLRLEQDRKRVGAAVDQALGAVNG